jgi:hypothetical protein
MTMCGALVLGTALMLSADASRDSKWSEWSTPVNLGAGINTPFVDAPDLRRRIPRRRRSFRAIGIEIEGEAIL